MKHTVAVVTHADVLQNFYTTWVRGVACQKQCLEPKLDGDWAREAFKKCGTPYVFLQPLKLATSNSVHKLDLGLAYKKRRLGPKLAGIWARGTSKINLGPPTYFCSRRSWQLQIWYTTWVWDYLTKKTFRTKIGGGLGQESIQKKLGPPIYF